MTDATAKKRGPSPLLVRKMWREQLRVRWPILLAAFLFTSTVFIVVTTLHFQDRVPAYELMEDVAPAYGLPLHAGLLSDVGVLLWWAAAMVCGFAGFLLRGVQRVGNLSRFLLGLGGLNAWLALDDQLVLHEQIGEALFGYESRYVGEALLFLTYAAAVAIGVVRFWGIIVRTEVLLLCAAVVSFGMSIAIDVVMPLDLNGNNILLEAVLSRSWGAPVVDITEEMLKLNGILLWFAYALRVSYTAARDALWLSREGTGDLPSSSPPRVKKEASRF